MSNMFIQLSYFLDSETPLYGGGKGIVVTPDRSIKMGDTANTKQLHLGNHAGTHIDFPNHFYEDGKQSQNYEASFWIFNAPFLLNVKAEENELILLNDSQLQSIPIETDFLIVKTNFGRHRNSTKYWNNNPGLNPDMSKQLKLSLPKLRVVGMDIISITSFQDRVTGRLAHKEFLGDTPLLLVEDMKLDLLDISPKKLMCFPLLVNGVDGAPVNVIAEI